MITYTIWKSFHKEYIIKDYTPEEKASNFVTYFLLNILLLPIEIFLIPSSIVYFISLKYFKHQEDFFKQKFKGEENDKN